MGWHISTASRLPIYQQLAQQIREAIARGELQPEANLPSVRQLSRELVINPNTVARAYRDLQAQGILAPLRGTGLAVTPHAAKHCGDERVSLIRERMRSVLLEARRSRLELDEIRNLVDEELARLEKKGKNP